MRVIASRPGSCRGKAPACSVNVRFRPNRGRGGGGLPPPGDLDGLAGARELQAADVRGLHGRRHPCCPGFTSAVVMLAKARACSPISSLPSPPPGSAPATAAPASSNWFPSPFLSCRDSSAATSSQSPPRQGPSRRLGAMAPPPPVPRPASPPALARLRRRTATITIYDCRTRPTGHWRSSAALNTQHVPLFSG
jgi:hypothetical protein